MLAILKRSKKINNKKYPKGTIFKIIGMNWGSENDHFYFYLENGEKIEMNDVRVSAEAV